MSKPLDDETRQVIRRAFAMRADAYAHLFDVMRETLGTEQAMAIGMEATRRMGVEMGKGLAQFGPRDLAGLKEAFLGGIIDGETMFAPEVVRCDQDELRIHFHRCPLKEAWAARGRSDEDLRLLCRLAGAIDRGLFESAGFAFAGETWKPGEDGCCRLRVLPGPPR